MGTPEWIVEEYLAVEEARQPAAQAASDVAHLQEAADVPSCSAALGARSIEEQVAPI